MERRAIPEVGEGSASQNEEEDKQEEQDEKEERKLKELVPLCCVGDVVESET